MGPALWWVYLSLSSLLFTVSLFCFVSVCLSHSLFPCFTPISSQNGAIMNKGTGRCLEVENRGLAGIDLILRSCTGQRWTIKNSIK